MITESFQITLLVFLVNDNECKVSPRTDEDTANKTDEMPRSISEQITHKLPNSLFNLST